RVGVAIILSRHRNIPDPTACTKQEEHSSAWPQISNPHPLAEVRDRHLRIPIAKITVEMARLVLPADTIPHAPLRHHAGGRWSCSPGSLLAGPAGFATGKTRSAAHLRCLKCF